jgi:hypothetical protein
MTEKNVSKALAPKFTMTNSVTFPRELRDAIPDHQPSAGRALKLESVDAQPANTVEWGRRVDIKLQVRETGKLNGVFDVWIDIEIDAAKALAETILAAAELSAKISPVHRPWPI